jgi:site-specific DNA-methyltransferase (adenine-specific)
MTDDRRAINETEKPTELLEPLISYACPPGGTVLDPFAGSCSTGVAARALGCKAVLIERREDQCEKAAKRLAQQILDFGEVSA